MMEACSGGAWSYMIREGTRSRRIMYKVILYDYFLVHVYVSCGAVEAKYGTPLEDHIL